MKEVKKVMAGMTGLESVILTINNPQRPIKAVFYV